MAMTDGYVERIGADEEVAEGESEAPALCDAIADGEEHTVAEGLER